MQVHLCGGCKEEIDDDIDDSVKCDICFEWYHQAPKKCSSLKKTIFKVLTKNDTWVCPICISVGKQCRNDVPLEVLKQNVLDLTEVCERIKAENRRLVEDLNIKEIEVQALKDRLGLSFRNSHFNNNNRSKTEPSGHNRRSLGAVPSASAALRTVESMTQGPTRPGPYDWNEVVRRRGGGNGRTGQSRPHEGRRSWAGGPDGSGGNGLRTMKATTNRFSALSINDEAAAQKEPEPENPSLVGPKLRRRQRKRRVRLFADSHGWGCGPMIQGDVGDEWDVGASVVRGAPMAYILDGVIDAVAEGETVGQMEEWTDREWIVVVGGTNNITESSLKEVEDKLVTMGEKWKEKKANILFVETTHRHDDPTGSLNELIDHQNSIVEEFCSKNKWHFLKVNDLLYREEYAKAGLHLNNKGKSRICKLISRNLRLVEQGNKTFEGDDSFLPLVQDKIVER